MKMRTILCFSLVLWSLSLQGQNFEKCLMQWIKDAPNAFEQVEKNYSEKASQACGKVVENHGVNHDGIGNFRAVLEIASSKDGYKRNELHERFHQLKTQMQEISKLKSWEYKEFIQRYFGRITYQKEQAESTYSCELALKTYGDYEAILLTIKYKGPSDKEGKLSPWGDELRVPSKEDTTILAATKLEFNQDIRADFVQPQGLESFKNLLAAAENEFQSIKAAKTAEEQVYLVKPNFLNPKAPEPHQIIVDKGQMRIELQLRFVELYGALGWRMDSIKKSFNQLLKEDWNIQQKIDGSWSAQLKNGKKHIQIVRRQKNNIDYLVIEVIKKPFRTLVQKYPQLLKGNCLKGNCINGFGSFVAQDNQLRVRYEGSFKDGYYDGIGEIYIKSNLVEDEEHLVFTGTHKKGEREGYGITYDVNADPLKNFRKESEYFQKEEQTTVFSYMFQEYKADSLMKESLCSFLYYDPNSKENLEIKKAFTLDNGKCISGDCENGEGRLSILNLGELEGRFINGKANGKAILKLETGEWKSFFVYKGVPKYLRTLKLPDGVSRLAAAKRHVWQLADFDCLEGNCYNGQGIRLRMNCDRFLKYNIDYPGYIKATFKNQQAVGAVEIFPIEDWAAKAKGQFKNGALDGKWTVKWPQQNEISYEYYKEGRRVTESGQDYAEFLAEQREAWQADYERRLAEAIAEGRAEAARREAELRKRREAERKRQGLGKPRRYRCSCNGSGVQWVTTTHQDCTTTYSYNYSHGEYRSNGHYSETPVYSASSSTNCRDVESGHYAPCHCGGRGWYTR